MPSLDSVGARAARTHTQLLPSVVRAARTEADPHRVTRLRVRAYGRYLPVFAAGLHAPEPADRARGTVVVLCERKHDAGMVGSVRLQVGHGLGLPLRDVVALYRAAGHGLTRFMVDTDPPDMIVDATGLRIQAQLAV